MPDHFIVIKKKNKTTQTTNLGKTISVHLLFKDKQTFAL